MTWSEKVTVPTCSTWSVLCCQGQTTIVMDILGLIWNRTVENLPKLDVYEFAFTIRDVHLDLIRKPPMMWRQATTSFGVVAP